MSREQFEAFVKKHTFAIIALGGGAVIALVIFMRSRGSSTKANLDTIHSDLTTLDFDLNQIDTNLNTSNNWTSTTGQPVKAPAQPQNQFPPLTSNVYVTKTGDTLGRIINMEYGVTDKASIDPLIREVIGANPTLKSWDWSKPFPVGTSLTIPDVNPVISGSGPSGSIDGTQAKRTKGKGPVDAYIPDGPTDVWAYIGASDLMSIFDTWHQTEVYSLPGDYNDFANLN